MKFINRGLFEATLLTLICATLSANETQPALAAPSAKPPAAAPKTQVKPAAEVSSAKLISLIQSAKILDPDYPIHISLDNNVATVVTVRHPQATEQDCKIDAVLLAKTIMDAYPGTIARVKLVLSASNSEVMNELTVTTGDVKAFANGSISKEELLASLELKKADVPAQEGGDARELVTSGGVAVPAGLYRSYRQILAGRIEKLKASGTGTKPFEEMLAQIQEKCINPAGEQPDTILQSIKNLYEKLAEQELAIHQAHNIATGGGYARERQEKFSRGFGGRAGRALGQSAGQSPGQSKQSQYLSQVMPKLFKRVGQLNKSGQDTHELRAQLQQIRQLRLAGQEDEAVRLVQPLAIKLGMQ